MTTIMTNAEADDQNYHDYHDDNEDECDIEGVGGGVHSRPACRANRCGWMVAHYRPQSPNIDHYFKIGAQYSTWCSIIQYSDQYQDEVMEA